MSLALSPGELFMSGSGEVEDTSKDDSEEQSLRQVFSLWDRPHLNTKRCHFLW